MNDGICGKCAAKDAVIETLKDIIAMQCPTPPYTYTVKLNDTDPTRYCPCRPENGGSGVCSCVLNSGVTCR